LLSDSGALTAREAEKIAHQRYRVFDENRKQAEREETAKASELDELKRGADAAKAIGRQEIKRARRPDIPPAPAAHSPPPFIRAHTIDLLRQHSV
jgi:hypothetical protein